MLDNGYDTMTREELIYACKQKDNIIKEYLSQLQKEACKLYNKSDIMELYGCEGDKALRILKLMYQVGKGVKIGKGYYTTKQNHNEFIDNYLGKTVFI